jgi:hypothetical protein
VIQLRVCECVCVCFCLCVCEHACVEMKRHMLAIAAFDSDVIRQEKQMIYMVSSCQVVLLVGKRVGPVIQKVAGSKPGLESDIILWPITIKWFTGVSIM